MAVPFKSERLKKLEVELQDLEQWMKLGLVPKKDLEKHKEEIHQVKSKIEEEKDRLQFLKENGDLEEYITPKRQTNRPGYQSEMPSIPEIEFGETAMTEAFDQNTESDESDNSIMEDREEGDEEESSKDDDDDEESFFSDRSPWRSEGIIDPDANEW